MTDSSISIVIPTLNAAVYLPQLLEAIFSQEGAQADELILIDSQSSDRTAEIAAEHPRVRLITIDNFSHGGARNLGAREAHGDIVVFLTQDALPYDKNWLAKLTAPLNDDKTAAVCSRQIPRDDASPMEKFFLAKRFGETRLERNLENLEKAGYEEILFSDVSCAIKRSVLLKHPFDETLIMSEDQQLSRDLIAAGYTVTYEPTSVVIHSHRYTLWQTFKRYFDSVCALRAIFRDQDMRESAAMGRRYVAEELRFIARHHPLWLPYYLLYTSVKIAATIAAHHHEHLPNWLRRHISMHAYHWNQPESSN
jgi:rhamnosyltransferase